MWGVELTEFKLLPDLLPTAHNETKRFNSGGRSYAPNHPADRLRGTSRHHYLGGGLDERRRPTRLAGAPASQGSCRSLGRRGLEASHRGFQIPPICRRHYCGALAAPSLSPQAYARSGASPRLYTLLRTFFERKNYARVSQRSAPPLRARELPPNYSQLGGNSRDGQG